MCQQFRLVQSMTPTIVLESVADQYSLLYLFTFQQTSDKINEKLQIIVSVRNRHLSFNTWSEIISFPLNLFTYNRQVRREARR